MEPPTESELTELEHHWGGAYVIASPEPGVWLAQRRDNRAVLRAGTAEALFEAIRADYGARPVSRDKEPPS